MTDNHIPSTHSNLFFSVALLHSVNIAIPEPAIPSQVPLNALFFHGIPDSYVEVPVGVNSFSAESSMAILFYVYFEEAYQTATLIQFDGAAGGFELCLKNGVLTAIFFSTDGTRYEHSAPDFHLQSNSWHFIGAEYNNMWGMNDQFDLLHVDVSSEAKEIPRYISTLTESGNIPNIDISGCFRLGQNFLRNSSFKGYMSCLQFYTVSVFSPKDTMRDLYEKCDPSVWTTECKFL